MAVDFERMNQVAAEIKESGDWAYKRLKLKKGRNVVRILAPFEGRDGLWFIRCDEVFNVGPNKKKIVPPGQFGLPDPWQDEKDRLLKLGDKASKQRAAGMKIKKRAHIWGVVRSQQMTPDGQPITIDPQTGTAYESYGPQLWSVPNKLLGRIIAIFNDPDYGDITNVENGRDLVIDYTPKEDTKDGFPDWQPRARPDRTPLGDPSWMAEDLFDKHKIGEPSEPEYVIACLKGTEEAYKQARKAQREAAALDADAPAHTAPTEVQTPSAAPGGSERSAVEKSLEEIRLANLKAAKAHGMDIDKRHVSVLNAPPTKTPPELLTAKFWAGINGETKELTGQQIQEFYVDKGHGDDIQLMTMQQADGWKTATTRGFVKLVAQLPAPPPPAGGPPGPPPPPSGQSVRADLTNALS